MNLPITIHFLGAAGTVTGSKYLIKVCGKQLLVDCGLFQGLKTLRQLNWDYLPINAKDIDIVLLTHAHLDHTGYLPRLVGMGFKGKILGTAPTLEVAAVILKDSGKIQEEEAERANREGYSKHHPAKPLYNLSEAEDTLPFFYAQPLNTWIELFEGVKVRFRYNGHIIGATFIELEIQGKQIVFSGDIGREKDVLLYSPERPEKADILLIESTYGDRLHLAVNIEEDLSAIVTQVWEQQGLVIIPSFAVERTQSLMYILWKLQKENKIPSIPIIMDSPMGKNVLNVFGRGSEWHKLSSKECEEMCSIIKIVDSVEESQRLVNDLSPKIVIAGSGMATGGRVLSYLERHLGNSKATVLLVGYQAEGTRGRLLLEGAKELKMHGKQIAVKATVKNLDGLSGHADQRELLNWISALKEAPKKIFITHGETQSSQALKEKIMEVYGWEATIPSLYQIEEVDLL